MILPENKMPRKLFLCAVCKIASIECSCLPSATKWVQCDCECAVERLGSGGGGRPYPQCATRDAWSLHAPAGDDNEVHFVVHMDVLDVEAYSGKVVVPAYKNRTTHGGLNIIVSHVTKFHGF